MTTMDLDPADPTHDQNHINHVNSPPNDTTFNSNINIVSPDGIDFPPYSTQIDGISLTDTLHATDTIDYNTALSMEPVELLVSGFDLSPGASAMI
jgi:hypothetical protein